MNQFVQRRAFPFQSLHNWNCRASAGATGLLGSEFAPSDLAVV